MSKMNEHTDSPLNSKTLANILIITATLGIVGTSFIVYYTKTRMKLNSLIKSMLIFQFLQHILNHGAIIFIAIQLTYNYDSSDQITCFMFGFSALALYPAHFFMNTAITVTRLFIAWKTENHRLFDPQLIMKIIIVLVISFYGVKLILLYLAAGKGAFFQSCLYKDDGNNIFNYLSVGLNIFIVICGGFADAFLVYFLKKMKKRDAEVQKNEPIPWKSGNHSKTSLRVPVMATVLSSISFLTIMLSIFIFKFTSLDKEWKMFYTNFKSILTLLILDPVTIFLTVKYKQAQGEIINRMPKFLSPKIGDVHESTANSSESARAINSDPAFGNTIEPLSTIAKPLDIHMESRNVTYIVVKSCEIIKK